MQPPPFEWAVVAAFYAAVHYVNAIIWERDRTDPGDHQNRVAEVCTNPALSTAAASYQRLKGLAHKARYAATFRIQESDLSNLLNVDLEAVRRAVLGALGISAESS